MNRSKWCGLGVLLFLACGPRHLETAATAGEFAQPMGPSGWYQVAPGHQVLVSQGPRNSLRILDFDSVRFAGLKPQPDSSYRWEPGGRIPERRVTFDRGEGGKVSALRWTDSTGASGRLSAAPEFPFTESIVHFSSADSTWLTGVVLIPRTRKLIGKAGRPLREVPDRLPAAMIIQGSGDSDRDNVWAYHIAQVLARAGIVVLLPDKRGSGDSDGDWKRVGFSTLADDAIAGIRVLRNHWKVDSTRVGVVGLSQGGWIAPLVADLDPAVAFVVDISGAAVTPFRQVSHEVRQDLGAAGLDDSSTNAVMHLFHLGQNFSRSGKAEDWSRYDSLRTALSRGPLAAIVSQAQADSTDWSWQWWRKVGEFDPAPLWARIKRPVLVVYGADDEKDNVPVAESVQILEQALQPSRNPGHLVRVFEGTGHTSMDSKTGWVSNDVLDFIRSWIVGLP